MTEEVKKEESVQKDFKIAEIWLRSGRIELDAGENFWADRCRALGVLEFCKYIISTAQVKENKPKVISATGKIFDFVRNFKRKK